MPFYEWCIDPPEAFYPFPFISEITIVVDENAYYKMSDRE